MNYIELINNFWSYTEEKEISSSDTSVYFALLKFNNALNWVESFRCDWFVICQYSRVSKNTFYRSLDNLQDLKLITYQKGERNGLKPKITVLKKKNKKGTIREQQGNNKGTQVEQNCEQNGNLYKLLNKETIKLINTQTKVFCDFVESNLDLIFLDTEKKESDFSNLIPLDNPFLEKVCNYFSQTTENLKRGVWSFLNQLKNENKLDEFKEQTNAYIEFKKLSDEKTHSWKNFKYEFQNEELDDFIDKLSKIKKSEKNNKVVIN